MKTAGDILSVLFDERFIEKAQGYSKLFDSWTDITAKNGIAAASAHSRIKNLDRGILLVETDHPGWKQILQTKQTKLLDDYHRRFPDLEISGISLMLGKCEPQKEEKANFETEEEQNDEINAHVEKTVILMDNEKKTSARGLADIKDEELKKMLINLGKSITERKKSGKK
jgi:hypothetical protein